VENGFSVAFFPPEDLPQTMKQTAVLSPKALRRKKYLNVPLLVGDEVGFQDLNRNEVMATAGLERLAPVPRALDEGPLLPAWARNPRGWIAIHRRDAEFAEEVGGP